MKKSIEVWLTEYGQSHTNPINKLIHWLAVPVIFISVFGLLWDVPIPALFANNDINWAGLALIPVIGFYLRLSKVLALAMTVFSALMLLLLYWLDRQDIMPLAQLSIIAFVIMWVFQFIGHHIEGKKPSFFKDIQFLLIGPLWLMAFILRRFNIPY